MTDAPHDDSRLMDHEYDGIREYDNPLPGWWTWLWILSIVFSVCYVAYYHIGIGPSVEDNYQSEAAAYVEGLIAKLGDIRADNATILKYMNNADWMAATGGMFVGNCAQCHAADGGGNVGPNLTDDYYKNIKEPRDLFKVITEGVPGKGMQAWEERLSEPQRILLAAYVASLRGTSPVSPKEREGSAIAAWSTFQTPSSEDAPASGDES